MVVALAWGGGWELVGVGCMCRLVVSNDLTLILLDPILFVHANKKSRIPFMLKIL